jgi:hypothetical protein
VARPFRRHAGHGRGARTWARGRATAVLERGGVIKRGKLSFKRVLLERGSVTKTQVQNGKSIFKGFIRARRRKIVPRKRNTKRQVTF